MLAGISDNILLIFLIAVLVISVIAIIAGVIIIIRAILQSKKNGNYSKFRHNIISVICVFVAAVSWIK